MAGRIGRWSLRSLLTLNILWFYEIQYYTFSPHWSRIIFPFHFIRSATENWSPATPGFFPPRETFAWNSLSVKFLVNSLIDVHSPSVTHFNWRKETHKPASLTLSKVHHDWLTSWVTQMHKGGLPKGNWTNSSDPPLLYQLRQLCAQFCRGQFMRTSSWNERES